MTSPDRDRDRYVASSSRRRSGVRSTRDEAPEHSATGDLPQVQQRRSMRQVENDSDSKWPIAPADTLLTPLGKRFRGERGPTWTEGENGPQTAREAEGAKRNLVNLLKRRPDAWGETIDLAERLSACETATPCRSGACPVCWRALRRTMVHASRKFFSEKDRWLFVTLIGADDRADPGKLPDAGTLAKAEYRLARTMLRIGARAFGGFHVTAHEHATGAFSPYWDTHPHIISPARQFRAGEWTVRKRYPASPPWISRPVLAKPYDGNSRVTAYGLTPMVDKRIKLPTQVLSDGTKKRRSPRNKRLVSHQRVELALTLDRAGIEARIIMIGYELVTDDADVQLVFTKRKRAEEHIEMRRVEAARRRAAHQATRRQKERDEFVRLTGIDMGSRRRGLFD